MTKINQASLNFETALVELNLLVEKMEKGGLPLEESLQYFEQGVSLIRHCQTLLKTAEQKIQLYANKEDALTPYQDE